MILPVAALVAAAPVPPARLTRPKIEGVYQMLWCNEIYRVTLNADGLASLRGIAGDIYIGEWSLTGDRLRIAADLHDAEGFQRGYTVLADLRPGRLDGISDWDLTEFRLRRIEPCAGTTSSR